MTLPGIAGRTVLVTGASRGIGLGIARAFAAAGAELHLLAEDEGIFAAGASLGARAHRVDITREPEVAALAEAVGRLDVLINNAGLERPTPLADAGAANEAVFRRVIEVNVTGTFLVTRALLPRLGRGSRVINTASIWGRVGEPLFAAYVASKHAVLGLTRSWAKELGPRAVTVNAVCPGWVRTESALRSLASMARVKDVEEAALLEDIVGAQALPGLMEPDDVAGPYLFLASDLAANVTGQSLGVDRGELPW